jgi:hypothetical protein
MTRKKNCWEVLRCGKQPGGSKVGQEGPCPAAVEQRTDGINDGRNAGRVCWLVKRTLCHNQVQDGYADKLNICMRCEFYLMVKSEELHNLASPQKVIALLRNEPSPESDAPPETEEESGE